MSALASGKLRAQTKVEIYSEESFAEKVKPLWNDQTHSRAGAWLEQGRDLCQWHSMADWRVKGETLCGKSEDGKSPSEQDWGKTSQVRLEFIYCLGVYTCVH